MPSLQKATAIPLGTLPPPCGSSLPPIVQSHASLGTSSVAESSGLSGSPWTAHRGRVGAFCCGAVPDRGQPSAFRPGLGKRVLDLRRPPGHGTAALSGAVLTSSGQRIRLSCTCLPCLPEEPHPHTPPGVHGQRLALLTFVVCPKLLWIPTGSEPCSALLGLPTWCRPGRHHHSQGHLCPPALLPPQGSAALSTPTQQPTHHAPAARPGRDLPMGHTSSPSHPPGASIVGTGRARPPDPALGSDTLTYRDCQAPSCTEVVSSPQLLRSGVRSPWRPG